MFLFFTINHLKKPVYYRAAQQIAALLSDCGRIKVKEDDSKCIHIYIGDDWDPFLLENVHQFLISLSQITDTTLKVFLVTSSGEPLPFSPDFEVEILFSNSDEFSTDLLLATCLDTYNRLPEPEIFFCFGWDELPTVISAAREHWKMNAPIYTRVGDMMPFLFMRKDADSESDEPLELEEIISKD